MDVDREHFVLASGTLRLLGTLATPLRCAGIQMGLIVNAYSHVPEWFTFEAEIRVALRLSFFLIE